MRIAVLRDRLNPLVTEAIALLRARGASVDVIGADGRLACPAHDLYYVKTTAAKVLSLAAALHAAGAATINAYPRVEALADKAAAAAELRAAGVPVPETWSSPSPASFEGGPWVVKPRRGSRGRGVRVLYEMPAGSFADDALVQRYHPSDDGMDHKIYCIGERVFGVRRRWPCESWEEKLRGAPFVPDARLEEIARRAGRALGLELFGLDVVVSRGEPYVVDVNPCAGFLGVPDGARLLAEHLAARAARSALSPAG